MAPRILRKGQMCQIWIHDVAAGQNRMIYETSTLLLEAPNWSLGGDALYSNGDGFLWRIPLAAPCLQKVAITGTPPFNNDHVLAPDGVNVFLSTYDDWQIYHAALAGGAARLVSSAREKPGMRHFLHGVSPDGHELAFVGITVDGDGKLVTAEIFAMDTEGKNYRQLTSGGVPTDGPEYSPDGNWIYYNTEQFTGHAQIARMRRDGSVPERLSFAETVDWFPHLAPDGRCAVYLAYPSGTRGHPADLDVKLMLVRDGDWSMPARVAQFNGGQGTINVNSWAPDSSAFAYVAYPMQTAV